MYHLKSALMKTVLFLIVVRAVTLWAQNPLPTAQELASQMTLGWNLGNTMEVPEGPTYWGNPFPTQELIDSVKSAGFNTIRIPVAWDSHANQNTLEISTGWMDTVKMVVDYAIDRDLFVMLNIHWDSGWLEENITSSAQAQVNHKQGVYWKQIANAFRDYDEKLLFASANEPHAEDATAMSVLLSYHQTFIDTVRATGGNNASRTLIIQGPKTDIELTDQLMNTMPDDVIDDRLMAEVHYYSPYPFCLMTADENWSNQFFYWGSQNHSPDDTEHNPTWGEESFLDDMFNRMKTKFVDQGIPVVLGEFAAIRRTGLSAENQKRHDDSREYFYEYLVSSAKDKGLIPVLWEQGNRGPNTMTVLHRETGEIIDSGAVNALRRGFSMAELGEDSSPVAFGANAPAAAHESFLNVVHSGSFLEIDFAGFRQRKGSIANRHGVLSVIRPDGRKVHHQAISIPASGKISIHMDENGPVFVTFQAGSKLYHSGLVYLSSVAK